VGGQVWALGGVQELVSKVAARDGGKAVPAQKVDRRMRRVGELLVGEFRVVND
jgi:hypothetical protein